eukprot:scaffold13674_cov61-Phaeocystis_antarctica.AAC.11
MPRQRCCGAAYALMSMLAAASGSRAWCCRRSLSGGTPPRWRAGVATTREASGAGRCARQRRTATPCAARWWRRRRSWAGRARGSSGSSCGRGSASPPSTVRRWPPPSVRPSRPLRCSVRVRVRVRARARVRTRARVRVWSAWPSRPLRCDLDGNPGPSPEPHPHPHLNHNPEPHPHPDPNRGALDCARLRLGGRRRGPGRPRPRRNVLDRPPPGARAAS